MRLGPAATSVVRCWAGFASLGAGLVHAAVLVSHGRIWWGYGAFFAVVAAYQIGWALAALARERLPWWRRTVAVQVSVLALWALTRTAGVPVGPQAGAVHQIGTADAVAAALGVVTLWLVVLVAHGRPASSPAPAPGARPGLRLALLGAGALAMSVLTTPALAATEAGEHARPHGSHGGPDIDTGPEKDTGHRH